MLLLFSTSSRPFLLLLLLLILQTLPQISLSLSAARSPEKCGNFTVSFPFHISVASFRLSCSTNSSLFLHIDRSIYRVIEVFVDGLLVDFPASSACRQFNGLNSFPFSANEYLGISEENVVGLYDCEDSSLCKAGCETNDLPGCDDGKDGHSGDLGCCYPLSDHSAWSVGDELSVFGKFGCRGFSSWVVPRGTNRGRRGVKLEWAVPRNSSEALCDINARTVNATTVKEGVRCVCHDGFVGDGFVSGTGCLKSCYKDGKEAFGEKCDPKRHHGKKLTILAGVLAPVIILASLVTVFCLLKRPANHMEEFDAEQASGHNFHKTTASFRKNCRTRLFTYRELEEATKGFQDSHKLSEGKNGTIYAGDLADGSRISVHKIHCQTQKEFVEISSQVDYLSTVLHANLARIIGCCMDCGYTLLVVYEYPENGTLEDHLYLHESRDEEEGLDWFKRVNIAADVAGLLALLQYETYPPVLHNNITPAYIFLDEDLHAKVVGFRSQVNLGPKTMRENLRTQNNIMCSFAVLLLEIITGSKQKQDSVTQALQKIRSGKLEEIIDPSLYYHEQPVIFREQISQVADIATRCLLFGGDGKFGIVDAARELLQIVGGSEKKGDGIEETFSNSSLLQMISMSPDSIYLPKN